MPPLNSFGSIMSHAIELETNLRDFYRRAGNDSRASEADKRRQNLERVRRENVTEIKLEPIEGITTESYAIDYDDTSAAGQQAAEQAAARFYTEVTPHFNVREAQRAMERYARQHAELAG